MRFQRLALLLLAMVLFSVGGRNASAQAQSDAAIGSIKVSGQKRFSTEQIVAASGLKVGQLFRSSSLNDAVNRLGDSGAFEFARYNFHPQAGKVAVEIIVQETAKFHKCAFDNFIWLSEQELQERVRRNVPLYDGWAPEAGNTADAIAAALEKILKEKGIDAPVTHINFGALGDKNWLFVFTADGAKESVVSVNFDGATTVDSTALQKEAAPLLKRNYALTEFRLFSTATFIPFYRERGYLQIKIGDPTAKPAKTGDCLSDCEVAVTFPAAEGLVYQWGTSVWSGDLIEAPSALEKILGMKPGELANGKKIESGFALVRKEYAGKGYIEAQIHEDTTFDDSSKTVTYKIAIAQGTQYRMGELRIVGFVPSAAEKIKNLWRCKPGDIYDGNYLDEFLKTDLRKALNEAQARVARINTRPAINKESKTVDLLLEAK